MAFSNFHTHTVFSDGKNTVREMVDTAIATGMSALGISDHSCTTFDLRYCMTPAKHMELYEPTVREEIRRAREEHGFPVYLGIEWDYGTPNSFDDYDYRIGSVHYILREDRMYPVDSGIKHQINCIENEFHGNKLDYVKAYYETVVEHARKNKPDFIGHFDLLVKHDHFDETDPAYLAVAREALAECVKHVPLFEVNAGAVIRGLKKLPYPNPVFLEDLYRLGGKLILSSDAHAADKITFAFPEMLEQIRRIGFTHVSRFNGKCFEEVTLEEFAAPLK
jgi:histidinol-phosphatase (PHP family)